MIQITKISFKNFIPYYKVKEFNFGEESGTSIIFGDNNTGKTSFINGIRFLFFNYLKPNPDNHDFKIIQSINKLSYDEEDYNFYAYVKFHYNNDTYELKREYNKNPNMMGQPKSDSDFRQTLTLRKNNSPIYGDAQIKSLIDKIIPEDISEFMLFDGENIEKYIEILNNDSSSGTENRRVKEAINKIIGTPYLDTIIARLDVILNELNTEKLIMDKRNINNQKAKEELEKLNIDKIKKMEDKVKLESKIQENRQNLKNIETELENNGRTITIYNELIQSEEKIKNIDAEISKKNHNLKLVIQENIRNLQFSKLNDLRKELENKYHHLETKYNEFQLLEQQRLQFQSLINEDTCSMCGSKISSDKISQYTSELERIRQEINRGKLSKEEHQEFDFYNKRKSKIQSFLNSLNDFDKKSIINIFEDINELQFNKREYINKIHKLKSELGTDLELGKFFSNKYNEKAKTEKILADQEKALNDILDEIRKIEYKILTITKKHISESDTSLLEKEIDLLSSIRSNYAYTKEKFIISMRKKVEVSASEIFLRFVANHNKDIKRIDINENYRMKIMINDGSSIPIPGRGFNTLLALSLIFGLNHNSQLFGTIFFDAAFSVLQNKYTYNIIQTFNEMAPQLILLIHNDKIDINLTRDLLKEKLINEIEIYQNNNSYNTMIKHGGY